MTTPTLEQQEEMAQKLGFTWDPVMESWQYPDGVFCDSLPDFTDPTTLFKLVVPEFSYYSLSWCDEQHRCEVRRGKVKGIAYHPSDPGLALFWAIWKLVNGEASNKKEQQVLNGRGMNESGLYGETIC